MADIKLGYGCGIKATLLMPTGVVCDLRDALLVNAVLVLPNGSTMYAKDISADNVTNAIYVRLLADRELTTEGNYSILFNVKLVDGVMYSTVAVNFANVTTNADAEYKEIVLSSNLEVTDYPHNVQRTGASPKVSPRQTWLVYNDEAKAYEDTGIPAEVNFSDYYTKEETDAKVAELESNQNLIAFGDFEFPNDHSVKINKLYIFNTPNGKQTLYDDESVVRLHELKINLDKYGVLVLHKDGKAEVVPNFVEVLSTDIVLLRYNYDVDGGISGGLLYRWYLKSLTNTISQNSNVFIGLDYINDGYIRIAEREDKRFLEWNRLFVGFRQFTRIKYILLEESKDRLVDQSIEIQSGVPFYINYSEWDADSGNKVVLHHDNNFSSDSVMLGIIGGSKEVLGLPLMELLFLSDDVNEIETTNIVKSLSHQSILPETKAYLLFDGKHSRNGLYLMSNFIPVKEGESYSYTGNVGTLGVAIAGYSSDSENAFVKVILTNGNHNQKKVTIPSGVTHIRYCGRTDARLSFVPSILDMGVECGEIYYPILDYGYLNFDGTKIINTNYLTTDFIPVNEGEIFRYTGRCGGAGVAVVGYSASEENAYLATLVTNGEFNNHEFTIPSGVSFIRVCGANEAIGFNNPSLRKLVPTSSANISEWKGKNVVIIGDSISTNDNNTTIERNTPEILITSEDVGKSLSAYLTYYDVQNGLSLGGHTFTSAEIGKEVSFVPKAEDVGKAIGLPNNYNSGNVVVWWEYLKERMGINPIPVCWSGSSITSHEENVHDKYKTSYAWHPAQLRKCGIRKPGTMERTAPDVIIIYRGTNDFSHAPYTKLTNDYFENIDLEIADTDVVEGGYGFKEGMCLTIKKMRELYPFAKIVLCTLNVFKRINYAHYPTNNGLNSLPQYNNAIREIADYMGCGLIEFDKDGITFENCYPTYISDSAEIPTHPNNNGHYVMGMKALTDLKKL
jgi:hypothetical protein